jgi:hypothetical protein
MSSTSGDPIRISDTRGLKLLTQYDYNVKGSGTNYSVSYSERKLGYKKGAAKMSVITKKGRYKLTLGTYNLTALKTWKDGGKSHWIKLVKIEK